MSENRRTATERVARADAVPVDSEPPAASWKQKPLRWCTPLIRTRPQSLLKLSTCLPALDYPRPFPVTSCVNLGMAQPQLQPASSQTHGKSS